MVLVKITSKGEKMSKRTVLAMGTMVMVLIAALTIAGCSDTVSAGGGSQAASGVSANQRADANSTSGISVVGTGTVSAPPDVALVDLGVEVVDSDANAAFTENTKRMTAVKGVLKEMDIPEDDIQTVNYNMWIEQVYDRNGQPTGENRYHVTHHVRVRVSDLNATGELLQNTLEAGANNFGGISFSVADTAALQREARERALSDAKAKAEQLASSMGVRLGTPRLVSELGGQATPFLAADMGGGVGGGGPVPVSGGEFSVRVEIQLVFDIAE
jgi:uncharacterized protein YggE